MNVVALHLAIRDLVVPESKSIFVIVVSYSVAAARLELTHARKQNP